MQCQKCWPKNALGIGTSSGQWPNYKHVSSSVLMVGEINVYTVRREVFQLLMNKILLKRDF